MKKTTSIEKYGRAAEKLVSGSNASAKLAMKSGGYGKKSSVAKEGG
jgi:hypothetical protein